MTPFYAKSKAIKNVVFVTYPNIVLLDLTGPLQVFSHARSPGAPGPAYHTHVVSDGGGQVTTNTVVTIDSTPLEAWVRDKTKPIHTLVVVGGDGATRAANDPHLIDHIKQLATRATRICAVCNGALLLGAAGLLDGRRAVTHWEDCDQLAKDYPAVQVEVDPIFIKDGHIWTSAGITAGIDMALAIIAEDLGKPAAIAMARSLVTPMVRSGGQSQFSGDLVRAAQDAQGQFQQLHDWITNNLSQKIIVDDMAALCGMSPRNFSRRYADLMGTPPAKAVEVMRVDHARDLLATSDKTIQTVARNCGFIDAERMRRAFLRQVKTTPTSYRQQFQLG